MGNVDSFFDFVEYKFEFDRNTFYLEGSGKTRLTAKLANDDSLPPWLVFLPSQCGNSHLPESEPDNNRIVNIEQLSTQVMKHLVAWTTQNSSRLWVKAVTKHTLVTAQKKLPSESYQAKVTKQKSPTLKFPS